MRALKGASSMAADLLADTKLERVVSPDGAVAYHADLPSEWSYVLPSGGVLLSVALRAMRQHLDAPELELASASALFCDPVPAGPLRVVVTVLRRGGAAAQLRAHLKADAEGAPHGLEVTATFVRARSGPEVQPAKMPDVPVPSAHRPEGAKSRWAFVDNFQIEHALGEASWLPGFKAGDAHQAFWYRYRVPVVGDGGFVDPIAIPPIADTMPGALAAHLGPGKTRFFAPSLDLTVYFLAPTRSEWLLVETRVPRATNGWAVGQAWIWDAEGTLVAQANQAMFLRPMPAPSMPAT
jgi:acyl-CoA thioesterase